MSDYVISRQSREVFLVYKCPTCHNPVLLHSHFSSIAKITTSMFNSSTPEEVGNKAFHMLEENISTTCSEKSPLRESIHTISETQHKLNLIEVSSDWGRADWCLNFYAFGRAWLVMNENTCYPICGSTPLWMQNPPPLQKLKKLHKDCFPQIYHSIDLANLYANLLLQKRYTQITHSRLVPGATEKAQQDMLQKALYRQTLVQQAPQSGNPQLDSLTEEVNALSRQLKNLGTFNLKAKKSINEQIAEKQQKIFALKSSLDEEENRYKQELLQAEIALQELEYLANGPTGTAKIIFASDSLGYKLIPNPASEPPLPLHSF